MSLGEDQLKRIQEKLQHLLKQHDTLQKENKWLKSELTNSKKQEAQHHENIDRLKQQVEVLKLPTGKWMKQKRSNLKNGSIATLKK